MLSPMSLNSAAAIHAAVYPAARPTDQPHPFQASFLTAENLQATMQASRGAPILAAGRPVEHFVRSPAGDNHEAALGKTIGTSLKRLYCGLTKQQESGMQKLANSSERGTLVLLGFLADLGYVRADGKEAAAGLNLIEQFAKLNAFPDKVAGTSRREGADHAGAMRASDKLQRSLAAMVDSTFTSPDEFLKAITAHYVLPGMNVAGSGMKAPKLNIPDANSAMARAKAYCMPDTRQYGKAIVEALKLVEFVYDPDTAAPQATPPQPQAPAGPAVDPTLAFVTTALLDMARITTAAPRDFAGAFSGCHCTEAAGRGRQGDVIVVGTGGDAKNVGTSTRHAAAADTLRDGQHARVIEEIKTMQGDPALSAAEKAARLAALVEPAHTARLDPGGAIEAEPMRTAPPLPSVIHAYPADLHGEDAGSIATSGYDDVDGSDDGDQRAGHLASTMAVPLSGTTLARDGALDEWLHKGAATATAETSDAGSMPAAESPNGYTWKHDGHTWQRVANDGPGTELGRARGSRTGQPFGGLPRVQDTGLASGFRQRQGEALIAAIAGSLERCQANGTFTDELDSCRKALDALRVMHANLNGGSIERYDDFAVASTRLESRVHALANEHARFNAGPAQWPSRMLWTGPGGITPYDIKDFTPTW